MLLRDGGPPELAPILELIQNLHNKIARYVDARIDEAGDGTRLLIQHLEVWQRETNSLRARVERLEAAALSDRP